MKYQVMPELTPIEYEALKADIAQRGVLVAVEIDEAGTILDGHHRARAWEELIGEGIDLPDYPIVVRKGLTDEQKRNHARSLNVLRRHLSREQRDEVMREMRADGMTYKEIAQAVGVSTKTAHNVASDVELCNFTKLAGADGKARPATYTPRAEPEPLPTWAQEPTPAPPPHITVTDQWDHAETVLIDDEPSQAPAAPAMSVHFSSETPEHYTPREIIDRALACMGGIDLDPCSNSHEAPNVPAIGHYTREDDGLSQKWIGRVYMNPPYGREIDDWIEKLVDEYENRSVIEAIALVPARTDTQWWQRLRDYHVCLVTGRLRFIGSGNGDPAPFPSAVFYLGENVDSFVNTFEDIGDIWHRTRRGYCFGE